MLRKLRYIRLDLWEVILLMALVVLIAFITWRPEAVIDREAEYFHDRYGPHHASENEEEWIIRHFFRDKRDGFFVEIGANDYFRMSKTWYLETHLGWSGLAVEPLRQFEADYVRHRPKTRFLPFFVGERSDETATLYVIDRETAVSSSDRDFTAKFGNPDRVETVPTISLNDLFERSKVQRIDFLSIDIELHEPAALAGIDINRWKPTLVCVEALLPVRQQILNYFTKNDYVVNGRYLRADRENLYFMPLDHALAQRPGEDGSREHGVGAISGIK